MEEAQLDLQAPLLSVRRQSPAHVSADPRLSVPSLPFYKSEVKSGPVRTPGVVPFVWEQRAGQPKDAGGGRLMPGKVGTSVRTRRPPVRSVSEWKTDSRSPDGADEEKMLIEDPNPQPTPPPLPDPPTPPPTNQPPEVIEQDEAEDEPEHEERFLDALDTLSRTDSFVMNCSIGGLSGLDLNAIPVPPQRGVVVGSPNADPETCGALMDRFLPAAKALAADSPQYTFRKAVATRNYSPTEKVTVCDGGVPRRHPVPLPQQNLPPNYPNYGSPYVLVRRGEKEEANAEKAFANEDSDEGDEDDDSDFDDAASRHFMPKGCGFLPKLCMKGSFLITNPVPAMKSGKRTRHPGILGLGSPLIRSSDRSSLVGMEAKEQSWDAVYKHKQGQKDDEHNGEDRSKLTSESNQFTSWSNSPTAEGSPFHSVGAPSPVHDARSDRSVYGEQSGVSASLCSSQSPALKRDTLVGVAIVPSRVSLENAGGWNGQYLTSRDLKDPSNNNSAEHTISSRIEDSYDGCLQPVVTTAVEHGMKPGHKSDMVDEGKAPGVVSSSKSVEREDSKPALPLPLPKSPSESWLSRTLPSVSTKKLSTPPFSAIQSHQKKQAYWPSSNLKKESIAKSPKPRHVQFAEVFDEKP